ncbi:MAG: DUF3791 domain-containing protein [Tissierellales bacterium]|jgi:hypothetical protein|nr:DUF3791 domain-containing protein [Tissierellales bacterium]
MGKEIQFTVFCIESYKVAHNLTGKKTLELFKEYEVFSYIDSFYDLLHSTGAGYLVKDIDKYIENRRNKKYPTN